VIYFCLILIFPPVLSAWTNAAKESIGDHASMTQMVVNFFTVEDFVALLSRRAMLPLIVFSVLFGLAVNRSGEAGLPVRKFLSSLTTVMLHFVDIITYYAPVAFFAIFADLVATYGPQISEDYVRALLLYYPVCFIYIFTAFPVMAWIGAGTDGVREMFRHILKPAIVSLGTCSSIATIPTNMEAAADTGISRDISDIVLPLGATMHMDGSCFSCVLKIAFVLGVLGKPVTFADLPVIVLIAVFSSVGMSGVPGGGYIGEYIICTLFFPDNMELAFPILVAIGNLVDPPATMINAAGDYVVSFIVARFVDGKDWLKKAKAAA
ncbi:MAG: cation:dicarboxylase symporter family transporter, partial [Synergistaceae bacterium]|nr:cation:dicarboxylase symporter family transporter [Synergistaceae bacterium]